MKEQTWDQWLRSCSKDPKSPAGIEPGALGMLTGQDSRALAAISRCWDLYACSDEDGMRAALQAVRSLLPALQPQCRFFARELIARSLDWADRARLWARVTVDP